MSRTCDPNTASATFLWSRFVMYTHTHTHTHNVRVSALICYTPAEPCPPEVKARAYGQRGRKKYSYTKFHENPFSGSRAVFCGRTDITKLIVSYCNFADVPKANKI